MGAVGRADSVDASAVEQCGVPEAEGVSGGHDQTAVMMMSVADAIDLDQIAAECEGAPSEAVHRIPANHATAIET
jgi:hypothetical protein